MNRKSGFTYQNSGNDTLTITKASLTTNSLSLVQFYGADVATVSTDGMVWAANLKITTHGPEATKAGVAYVGLFKYESFVGAGLTIWQLLKLCTRFSITEKTTFDMSLSLNNSNIVYENTESDTRMINEDVAVLILRNPYINLTTGLAMSYDCTYSVSYNYLFWPDKSDVIWASLQSDWHAGSRDLMPKFKSQIPEMELSRILPHEDDSYWDNTFHSAPSPAPKEEEKSFLDKVEGGLEKVSGFVNTSMRIGKKALGLLELAGLFAEPCFTPQPVDVVTD